MLRAAGDRDAPRMLEGARTLLESGQEMPPEQRRYLLATGMLGALAQGDRGESLRLWKGYRDTASGGSEPDLLLRLLAVESGGH